MSLNPPGDIAATGMLHAPGSVACQQMLHAPGSVAAVGVLPFYADTMTPWDRMDSFVDAGFALLWAELSALDAEADMPWVMPWGATGYLDAAVWGPWSATDAADADTVLPWAATVMVDESVALPWGRVGMFDASVFACWSAVMVGDVDFISPWAQVASVDMADVICWAATAAIDIETRMAWAELAAADAESVLPWARVTPLDVYNFSPFEREYIRQARRRQWNVPWLAAARIVMYQQNIEFKRVDDNSPIRILAGSADIDVDSWCWRLRGTLPSKADAALVRPDPVTGDPVEVEITINGYVWRFLITSVSENYRWAKGTYQITGYSPTYLLGDPGPRITQTFDAQPAQQVVAGMVSGTDFSYEWDLPTFTWTLPAGALWVQDATVMAVIQRIPEAIGGVVQTDPDGYTLRLQSRYPNSPKTWASETPDETLMSGLITAGSRPRPQPRYNEVIVAGRNHGVIATVRRQGTAGDNPAPPISAMILTNQASVHERGRVELDTYGYHKSDETLLLPLPGPGNYPKLLTPGMHVAVADPADKQASTYHAQVSGVSVAFERARTRQSAVVERVYM